MICSKRSASASSQSERVLVTTLTKKMAEDLTDYLPGRSECKRTVSCTRISKPSNGWRSSATCAAVSVRRAGRHQPTCGKGLDLPEVSLVAILDADKEGYLRSERSLIQTIGRAARNLSTGRSSCTPTR